MKLIHGCPFQEILTVDGHGGLPEQRVFIRDGNEDWLN